LTNEHITAISDAYHRFEDISNFCCVVDTPRILENNSSLRVSLYLKKENGLNALELSPSEYSEDWRNMSSAMRETYQSIIKLLQEDTK
jgi:type I restriction-modification system DNA methylase subunit